MNGSVVAAQTAAATWVPLVELAALNGSMPTPVPVAVGGTPWALVVLDGSVSALYDVCPHRRVPLSAGAVAAGPGGSQVLECGYHGWSYDRTGGCARIPALGENIVPRGMGSVALMTTAVINGVVWGCLDPEPGAPPALSDDDVLLREQVVELDQARLDGALSGLRVAGTSIRTGVDRYGALRYAVRALDAHRCALFPLVSGSDGLPDAVAAWEERLGSLLFPPPPPAHER